MMNNQHKIWYQVRIRGDSILGWYAVDPMGTNGYDKFNLECAKIVADGLKGWVVKITEEVIYESL